MVYLQRWHGWCHMKLQPSRRTFCVHHAPCHFMQSHIRKAYACSVVTCHLHFWQNDRDLLRATAVPRGWNGYRNKSQHRKSTLEKKIVLPLLQGFEPATFQSRVRRSNHWAIPALWCWHTKWRKSYRSEVTTKSGKTVNYMTDVCVENVCSLDMVVNIGTVYHAYG